MLYLLIVMDDYWFISKRECLNIISQTTPLSCSTIRQMSIPRFLRRAVLRKKHIWHRYNRVQSPVRLTTLKSQSRLVSLLDRISQDVISEFCKHIT